jgi:hypothetical protein
MFSVKYGLAWENRVQRFILLSLQRGVFTKIQEVVRTSLYPRAAGARVRRAQGVVPLASRHMPEHRHFRLGLN